MEIKPLDDFITSVINGLKAEFRDCSVEKTNSTKNNGVCLCGITIKPPGSAGITNDIRIAQNVYMETYFAEFQKGRPFADIINELKSIYRQGMGNTEVGIQAGMTLDFDRIKDSICYMLVNKGLNEEFLSTVPHKDFYGLAVIYYIRLAPSDEGFATVKITDKLAGKWGVSEDELYEIAHTNTPRLECGCVMPLLEVMDDASPQGTDDRCSQYDAFDFINACDGDLPIFVVTNASKTHGAAVIMYDRLLEAVSERLGSFYVLPSSINECILAPGSLGNAEAMTRMVKDINATELAADELLYDGCFYYDAEKHKLQRV